MLDPYRPDPVVPQAPTFRFAWSSLLVFAWVATGALTMMVLSHAQPYPGRREMFAFAALATLLGVVAAFGLRAMHRANQSNGHAPAVGAWLASAAVPLGLVIAWLGAIAVHTSAYVPAYMGRRHRKGRTLFVPTTTDGEEWVAAEDFDASALPLAERAGLAAEWRDNGCKEHASVAAFAQLALDLMAVGAPPELIASVQRDSLDEIGHAGSCFAIARALDGKAVSPAPFPDARTQRWLCRRVQRVALTQIALDALVDGVLNEGIAARLLATLSTRCESVQLASILRKMAADESRHAAHSWDVVRFCLDRGGPVVAAALRGALDGMPGSVCSALPERARHGAWTGWGVQSAAMEDEAYAKTRVAAQRKLRALLAAPLARAA